jgi:mannose-6-phosphate isomerase
MRLIVSDATRPVKLPANQVPVYYAGGEGIARFRGERTGDGPEDWIGSVNALPAALVPAGVDPTVGISPLPDGRLLSVAIRADPLGWLGPRLAAAFGDEPGLLVKLLDAGERLPVHAHPDRATAGSLLGSRFGKTEGWIILDAAPGAAIWLGFREQVALEQMRTWVEAQDVDAMLAAMNRIEVSAGEAYYLPAGTVHAIGAGILLTELQEPTSFSILAEYAAFGLDEQQATLGLGWDRALATFDLATCGGDRLAALRPAPEPVGAGVERIFPVDAAPFFQAYRHRIDGRAVLADAGFSVLVCVDGSGALVFAGGELAVPRGSTWVVPFGAGPLTFVGRAELLRCVPPALDSA